MTQSIFYLNGQFLPAAEAKIPLNDLGLARGYGVFDFLRTYNGRPFHLEDHLHRLARSAHQIELTLPCSLTELADLVHETLKRNNFAESTIRIMVTGGTSADLMLPDGPSTLAIMVHEVKPTTQSSGTVITVRLQRDWPTVKSLNYIPAIMAMKKAKPAGAIEALYVNNQDEILEGTRHNFFGICNGRLVTPKDGILHGITRQVVLHIAQGVLPIEERPVRLAELATWDEAFISSSSKEVFPITQVDEQLIGDGQIGAYTRQLQQKFSEYAHQHS